MVEFEAKAALLRKRVAALSFPEERLAEAQAIVHAAGMRLPDAVATLRKEWLNDMVATTDSAEFRHASRDPAAHFLAWVRERAKNRFHVSWRAVDAVAARMGPEVASRLALVTWPQEIAWAQRLRLAENPVTATKAAMFLREAEGNPSRMFSKIADIYGDVFAKAGYSDHVAQEISPSEIRFADAVPDFNPLFLRYAARSYAEVLSSMPRDRIEILAARAARDERQDRDEIAALAAANATRRFPMRRVLAIISAAIAMGISPNELFLLENGFLKQVEQGSVEVAEGGRTPQAAFVTAISNDTKRAELVATSVRPDVEDAEIMWDVVHLDRRWLDAMPESYRKWSHVWVRLMENWQADIVEERREAPFDLISDFGFYLMENASA